MEIRKIMFNYIQEHPLTFSKICLAGALNMYIVEFVTSDRTMKLLSVLGGLVGLTAGILTVIVKYIEWKNLLKKTKK